MATATTTPAVPALANMGVEDHIDGPLRGRGTSPEIEAIGAELQKCLEDGTARSFQNVEQDDREVWARKIRTAGKNVGIEVATRYVKNANKLVWGPRTVLQALSSASQSEDSTEDTDSEDSED